MPAIDNLAPIFILVAATFESSSAFSTSPDTSTSWYTQPLFGE